MVSAPHAVLLVISYISPKYRKKGKKRDFSATHPEEVLTCISCVLYMWKQTEMMAKVLQVRSQTDICLHRTEDLQLSSEGKCKYFFLQDISLGSVIKE